MARCQHCGAFVLLPYKCNYCGGEFCPECRLPPYHDCAGMGSWRSTSAPHALVKMDRIHHPELWTPFTPVMDEQEDTRFYPSNNSIPDYYPHHHPAEEEVKQMVPSLRQRLRRWVRHQYREIAYAAWRFSRYIRKNWFWILAFVLVMYFYWVALIPKLM